MKKKNLVAVLLTFTALFLLSLSQMTYASFPNYNKPLFRGDPKLPPPPPQPARLTPGQRYQLYRANQQLQQGFNDAAQAGYNFGVALAKFSKK